MLFRWDLYRLKKLVSGKCKNSCMLKIQKKFMEVERMNIRVVGKLSFIRSKVIR